MLIANFKMYAQSWQQLGPGAGGQERAVYLDQKSNGKYDLYVGSDVSGVWKAADIDPAKIADPTSYNYTYISNHTIMRFTNKFYHSSVTQFANKLFVTYRNGIDRIDLNSNTAMQTSWTQEDSWVSDMYIGPQSAGTSQVYFTTGNTRVNGEASNRKSNTDDFFYGTISSSNYNITITNSFKFSGLATDGNVYCLNVDEGATPANSDDAFLVGTENGLYQFSAGSPTINHIIGPYGYNAYKVTSIQLATASIPNIYLITINGLGLFLYDKTNQTWTSQIIELNGEELTNGNTNYKNFISDYTIQNFNNLLPLKTGNTQYGWLLLNEFNLKKEPLNANYFIGVFYCPVVSGTNNLPDGRWKALSTWVGANDWAWNESKPCANINGALLTPDNSLLIGKSGNIMISSKPIDAVTPLNTTWIQTHSKEGITNNGTSCSNLYSNRGYVNTALKTIYKDNSGKIWNAQNDRLLWVSDDGGNYFKEVQKTALNLNTCFGIETLAAGCNNLDDLTDCFFINNDPFSLIAANELYIGVGTGYAKNKGRGSIMKLTANDFIHFGNIICGDPVKLLFTSTGEKYALFNEAIPSNLTKSYTHLFKYNTTTFQWDPIQLFTGTTVAEDLIDAVISPNGSDLFIIRNRIISQNQNRKFYHFTLIGSNWTQDVSCTSPNTSSVDCNKLCLVPFEDLLSNSNPSYKILCGTQPLNISTTNDNLYEVFTWNASGTTGTCTTSALMSSGSSGCAGTDIFQKLYFDNLDQSDGGINFIEVNANLKTIYVSTVYKDYATSTPMKSRVYRGTYNPVNGNIDLCWQEITSDMPNKAVKYMSSNGSTTCADEYIYAAVRGLGGWKLDLNKPTFSAVTTSGCSNNNGTATAIAPASFINPTYLWSNSTSATTATITGLSAGTYTVTVSATGFCTTTASVTILAETLTITKNNPSCNLGSNGSTTANYSGLVNVVNPYTWSNGATTETTTGLLAGTYTVTVSSTGGCTVSASIILTNPATLVINSTTTTAAICDGAKGGTLSVSVGGGTKPWQITVNNLPPQISNVFTNLPAATYSVTVTDFNGCTTTTTAAVNKIPQLPLSGLFTSGQAYDIIGTVALTGSLSLTGCTLYATDNSSITVPPNTSNTLSLTTTTINSCNNMWQGIINNGGTVIMNNCTIKDATTALFANTANSVFNITNNTFDQNDVSIDLSNQNFTKSTFTGNTFECTAPLKSLIYPGNNVSIIHIALNNATQVTIGNATAAPNTFKDASFGIYSNASELTANHNNFNNLGNNDPSVNYFYGGIAAYISGTLTVGTLSPNNFVNCNSGILTQGDITVTANNNNFNKCANGIGINSNIAGSVDVIKNTFTACDYGIYCWEIGQGRPVRINSNNLTSGYDASGVPVSIAGIAFFMLYGNDLPVEITDNTITDYPYGIAALNMRGSADLDLHPVIANNTINYSIDENHLGTANYYGILLQNCKNLVTASNAITWTAAPTDPSGYASRLQGIRAADCQNTIFNANTFTNNGIGIYLNNDAAGNLLTCNVTNNTYPGFFLDNVSNLPQQGSASTSNLNHWIGDFSLNSTRQKIDGFSNNPAGINWYYTGAANILNSNYPKPSPPQLIKAIPVSGYSNFNCGAIPDRIDSTLQDDFIDEVIGDSILLNSYTPPSQYAATEFAYRTMYDNYIIVNDVARLVFYQQTALTNIGTFNEIYRLVKQGLYADALVLNNTITNGYSIDENRALVNEALINRLANHTNVISVIDSSLFENIAASNAAANGDGVYYARAYLRQLIVDHNVGFLRQQNILDTAFAKATGITVYPVPVNNTQDLVITSQNDAMQKISIYNTLGVCLQDYLLPDDTQTKLISVSNFNPGFYNLVIKTASGSTLHSSFIKID